MKIERNDRPHMQNEEHFQLNTEFRDLVVKYGPAELNIEAAFSTFLALYLQEDEALLKVTKSAYTAKIQEADRRRDQLFRGMVDANRSAQNHFRPEVCEAAQRLKILFDTYGNVAKRTANKETAALHSLQQELTGAYAADAAQVGLIEWATELNAANQAFDLLTKSRYEETAQRTDLVLRQVRLQVDEAYRAVVSRIEALMLIDGEAKYEPFVRQLNAVVEKYSNTMATRKGRAEKKS
ncbi:MAG: DUF6261 family protein [Prevotellaceae bacterium]|jgi:hypothetical protein|nr:DUF6261 family protein [Prevotellaceae bacterium]